MRVTLLAFGVLRDLLPQCSGPLDLASASTVADLLLHLRSGASYGAEFWSSIAVAVNREYVPASHTLADGDEVALLPPVSGGAPAIFLTNEPIDTTSLVRDLKQGEDGAVVVFDGIVRNHTRDRRTLYLFYEAYPEMALSQMRQLAAEALKAYPIRDV